MNFLVYEQELLVREDIIETLKSAFSGVIHVVEDLQELGQKGSDAIMILSVSGRDILRRKEHVLLCSGDTPFVVICDDPPTEVDGCDSAHFVPRPFNSQTLIAAVKNALSSQRKDLS